MRVWELARELGRPSKELLVVLQELGFDATAPASSLSDGEAERIRQAYTSPGDTARAATEPSEAAEAPAADEAPEAGTGEDAPAAADEALEGGSGATRSRRWKLVGKASVSARGVVVRRGPEGVVADNVYRRLPRRQQAFFEPAD